MGAPAPPETAGGKVSTRSPREVAREVFEIEAAAIQGLVPQLDESFDRAVGLLGAASGRVVCTGMGKSGLILKKVAATLSSTGTPALFLHPAEAVHGDLGMVVAGDVVLAASYSGTTEELLRLIATVKRREVPLVAITGNAESPLAAHADVHLETAIDREACPLGLAPTASTTATLALGDALAMALSEARGFSSEDFGRLHPGGLLGRRLATAGELMHGKDELALVRRDTPLKQVLPEMSRQGFGIAAVVDDGDRLAGCISDGDLRRLLGSNEDGLLARPAGEVMHRTPKVIAPEELAVVALGRMEEHRITSLFVESDQGELLGLLHLHDLWGLGKL